MKKISMNLLKVGLFLILGLCVFSIKSEVKAETLSIEKEVGDNYTITLPNEKESGKKQAIWDYWIIDEGNKEDKNNTKSSYITATLDKNSILVQEGNGGYYQKIKIQFNKAGSCKLVIQARLVDDDGTWNYMSQDLFFDKYEYKIKVKESSKVTFTLDYNGGVNGNNKKSETVEDEDGSITIVDYSKKISKKDFTLVGWSKNKDGDGTIYKTGDKLKVKNNETLYAIWEVRFKLDYNGGTDKDGNKVKFVYDSDGIITIVKYDDVISKKDSTLLGWSKNKNGNEKIYKVGDKVEIQKDETLYAIWQSEKSGTSSSSGASTSTTSKTYTVKFNANGGTGSMSEQKITHGTKTALTKNAFKKDGYTFKGWYAQRSADNYWYFGNDQWQAGSLSSSGLYLYKDGANVSKTVAPGTSVTMYAVWEKTTAGNNAPTANDNTNNDSTSANAETSIISMILELIMQVLEYLINTIMPIMINDVLPVVGDVVTDVVTSISSQ